MTDKKRAWARITTASSAALLLMAVISLWQVFDDYNELYNPERNSLVKLEPGDSITFEIESSILVSALRVSDGDSPDADLKLTDDQGNVVPGRGARALEFDRYDERNGTLFSVVKVFENVEGGEYKLENLGTSTLWLVDDEDSANKLSGIVWTYLFYIGCCLGSPIGLVGFVLAVMVWTDKRKMPDQFLIIEDGRVIIGNSQSDMEDEQKPSEAPNPFSDTNLQPTSIVTDTSEEKDGNSWKSWDEG